MRVPTTSAAFPQVGGGFAVEPPVGIEPTTFSLRVPGGTSTGVAPSTNQVHRRPPRSVGDRSLGCSIGCSASGLAAVLTPSSRSTIGALPAASLSV